ncbi:hypothetical protein C8Q74DRAFT_1290988 [Fomes fomentarius]|nr:hypothetical protein C8Q74DRAFT_1290988 [Fomes fomentarius]
MEHLHFVRFSDPKALLDATKQYDDSFMNFCRGSLLDYLSNPNKSQGPEDNLEDKPAYLLAIYRGDNLLIALTKNSQDSQDFAWMMSMTSTAALTPSLLAAATTLLARSTLSVIPDPLALEKIIGPADVVDRFLESYAMLTLQEHGVRVRITPGLFGSRMSYATRASLPPLPAVPPPYIITLATVDDVPGLAPLYAAFRLNSVWGEVVSTEAATASMKGQVTRGLVWSCRLASDGPPVGYVSLGRVTPRTIAIRNVFVLEEHRRKGIAETVVRAVVRYYLGAHPYGVGGLPDGPPAEGLKVEVCLNVAEAGAERVYKRAGFLFPDREGDTPRGVDPTTGRPSWYSVASRDLALEESETASS